MKFLYLIILLLVSCGGGGNSNTTIFTPIATTINIPTFTLNSNIPRIVLYSGNKQFYNNYQIDTDIISNNYFNQNPKGHVAVVGRCNSKVLDRSVEGVGFLMGNVSFGYPSLEIETYMGLTNILLNPPNAEPPKLTDGSYHITYISYVSSDSVPIRTNQLIMYNNGIKIYDTGEILDPNTKYDTSFIDLCAGHVFDGDNGSGIYSNIPSWAFIFSNTKLTLQ